jgi:hypothetical protein
MDTPIDHIIQEARTEAASVGLWARRDHALHLTVASAAIVAGVLAGVSGVTEWQNVVTGVAGGVAAIGAGFQTFAHAEERSRFNEKQHADFSAVVRDGEIMRGDNPSRDEIQHLSDRLADIQRRVFGSDSPPGP